MDVVVVDDDRSGAELLRLVLESSGHRVRAFLRPDQALESLRAEPAHALVTDLMMGPARDGGDRLIAAVRADPSLDRVAVLAVTGVTGPDDLDRARVAGADAWLAKPVDLQELLSVLDRIVASRASATPGGPTP